MTTENIANRTLYTGDNLAVMRGINSSTIDLIYLDPPFNSKRDYAAPIGSLAAGAAFTDTWTLDDIERSWIDDIELDNAALWHAIVGAGYTAGDSMQAYLTYMAVRLIEMHRILKPTGSIYLHCDPTASHYLKQLMDAIFGRAQFRNEIIWSHQGSWIQPKNRFPRRHDTLLFYSKGAQCVLHPTFENDYASQTNYKRWKKYLVNSNQILADNMPTHDKRFAPYLKRFVERHGRQPANGDVVMEVTGSRTGDVVYTKVVDPKSSERTGYPTQKPLALLKRIIQASSNEGDLVLDPFAGCATTCVAAEALGRRWVGIDIEPLARDIVRDRLAQQAESDPLFKLRDADDKMPEVHLATALPERTDLFAVEEALRLRIQRMDGYRSADIKHKLYEAQEGRCGGGCENAAERLGRWFPIDIFEVDHVHAKSKGGPDIDDNLQLLCPTCNRRKGNRTMQYLIDTNAAEQEAACQLPE